MAAWLVAAYLLWPTDVPDDLRLPPVDEQELFPQELLDETSDFERFLRWNDIAGTVVLLAVLGLFAWKGWRFARESAAGRIGTGMLLGMIGLALVWIAQLPFAVAGIWWQKRYELVTAGYLEWALRELVPARGPVPGHLPVAADHDGAGGAAAGPVVDRGRSRLRRAGGAASPS